MNAREFVHDGTQILGALRHLDIHQAFDGLSVTIGMTEGADAADSLGNVNELMDIPGLGELFKSAVHEADARNDIDDLLVLDNQIEMKGLRQNRMLRAVRNHEITCHSLLPFLGVSR